MSVLLASDLDRTLIHPRRTVPEHLLGVALDAEVYEGRVITTCSEVVLGHLRTLAAAGAFAPVTTRSLSQLQRIEPVWAIARDGWAVCANGATLMHGGEPDAEWSDLVRGRASACAQLEEARAELHRAVGPEDPEGWLLRVRDCDAHFLYAILDVERLPEDAARRAQEHLRAFGWVAILHGRKLYVLPEHLTKEACVAHLAERLGVTTLVAAGDSLLDAPLLELADVRFCPADAELVTLGAVPEGARITRGRHLEGAEEIAAHAVELLEAAQLPHGGARTT